METIKVNTDDLFLIDLLKSCYEAFGVDVIAGYNIKSQQQRYTLPRFAFCKIAHENGYKLKQIADFLGQKNHASAIHAIRQANNFIDTNYHPFSDKFKKIKSCIDKSKNLTKTQRLSFLITKKLLTIVQADFNHEKLDEAATFLLNFIK